MSRWRESFVFIYLFFNITSEIQVMNIIYDLKAKNLRIAEVCRVTEYNFPYL